MADGRKDIISWSHAKVPRLENLSSFVRFLVEKRIAILFLFAILVLSYFFWGYLKVILVMAVFIAAAAMSMLYNRWVKVSLGVELVMLGLVISTVLFGRLPGLIVGMLGLFLAEIISERFTYSTFISFIGVFVVALIIPNIYNHTGSSVTATGILAVIIYDAIIIPGYLFLGSSRGRSAVFVVTHIVFSVWAFSFVAPLLLRLLQ